MNFIIPSFKTNQMKIPFFDLKRQSDELQNDLMEAMRSVQENGIFIGGERVDEFELVLEAFEIGIGDEVIIPAFGWVSVYTAVKRVGATPVFVDVDSFTGNLSVDALSKVISERTKAVIPIHLYGNPCDILKIKALCNSNDAILIEDCAQAHGAEVHGKKVGSFGHAAIYSFYPTKNLGALGDGGAIVTNDTFFASKIRRLKDYGRINRNEFDFAGRNSRLDELQAAVLLVKIKYLDSFNRKRQHIADSYRSLFSGKNQLEFSNSVFYQYPILVNNRSRFVQLMDAVGIMCDVHYPYAIPEAFGLFRQEVTNSQFLSNHVVSLPIYPELTEEEISYICEHLSRNKDWII